MVSPAAWLATAVIGGVAVGAAVHVPMVIAAVGIAVSWLASAIAFARCWPRAFTAAALIGSGLAGCAIGRTADAAAMRPSLLQWFDETPESSFVHLEGTLVQDASPSAFGVNVVVSVDRVEDRGIEIPASGGVRLLVAGTLAGRRMSDWRAGRRIVCSASLRLPVDYRDPGVPSERRRLARSGVVLLGTVKSAVLVERVEPGSMLSESAARLRMHVREAVGDAVGRWSPRSAGVVTAILIGDRSGLDVEDERRLQEAGTYHVIAISGGNIALLTIVLLALARWAGVSPRLSAACCISLVWFYGYTAGLAPSVLRATIAAVLVLAARTLAHRGSPVNVLGVAGATAAAGAPLTVVDPGFILSFGAAAAILVGLARSPWRPVPLTRDAPRAVKVRHALVVSAAALFGATLCAEIALAPVGARLFGRVTAAGLVLNFAAIPLMSGIQVAGMAAVAVDSMLPIAAHALGWIAHTGTVLLLESSRLVDAAPWLVRDVPPPGTLVLLAWYGGWAAVLAVPVRSVRLAGACIAALAGIGVVWAPPFLRAVHVPPPPEGWSRVVFLDVGQGDAALVWPAGAQPFLFDAGGVPGSTFDLGRRVTLPAAWAFGVSRLSALALSHGDPDHAGGALSLLRPLRPREVWEGVPVPGHPIMSAIHAAAAASGIGWREVRVGNAFSFGAARARVLNPPEPDWERRKVRNDDSIVVDIRIGGVSILLPGDITSSVEPEVARLFPPARITIVKAPHHGSAGSSSIFFVHTTHPAAVVFSAGQHNSFGHPAPVVVDRYRAAAARVFRTDKDGAIVLDTDGHRVVMWTYSGRREVIE